MIVLEHVSTAAIDPRDWIWIAGTLVVLFLGGLVALLVVKRRYGRPSHDLPLGSSFGLDQLRQMHQKGQLSTREYERLKTKVIAQSPPGRTKLPDSAITDQADPRPD